MSLLPLNFTDVPTEQLLLKELKEVTDDWKVFGVSLGIPGRKLKSIVTEDPNGGVENWKLKMFQFWLQYKPDASWEDVVRALEDNDYCNLAATLSKKYLLATDSAGNDDGEGGSISLFYNQSVLNPFYMYSCRSK